MSSRAGARFAVQHGGQAGGTLRHVVDRGRVAFNFRDTPSWDRAPSSPKGGVTHLDVSRAYVKRASDPSLKITVSGALVEAIDADARVDESQ